MARVTVLVPNYNHGRFLAARLRSILDQDYGDINVIYLDDASTDNSAEVFSAFSGDPRIESVVSATNSGSPFKQWNRGLRMAESEYVWIAESDDYADRRFLSSLVEQLDSYPSAGLAYCQSMRVDEDDNEDGVVEDVWDRFDNRHWREHYFARGVDELSEYTVRACTISTVSAVLMRREACAAVGYADESFRVAGDWDFYARMMRMSDVAYVAQPLNYWRTHSGSVRSRTEADCTIIAESYRVVRSILNAVEVDAKTREKSLDSLAEWWLRLDSAGGVRLRDKLIAYREARKTDTAIDVRLMRKLALRYYWSARVGLGALRRNLHMRRGDTG